jgi:hypothetical protein
VADQAAVRDRAPGQIPGRAFVGGQVHDFRLVGVAGQRYECGDHAVNRRNVVADGDSALRADFTERPASAEPGTLDSSPGRDGGDGQRNRRGSRHQPPGDAKPARGLDPREALTATFGRFVVWWLY